MEESSSKGDGDAGNDDKSPPKKARIEEQQQPVTSAGSSTIKPSTAVVSNGDLPAANDETAEDSNIDEIIAAGRDVSDSAPANPASSKDVSGTSSCSNQSLPDGSAKNDDHNTETPSTLTTNGTTAETASTSTQATVTEHEEAPSTSANRPAAENAPANSSRAACSVMNRERRRMEQYGRRLRRQAFSTMLARDLDDEELDDDTTDDDVSVNDEELTNHIANLLAPPELFDDSDSADGSPNDAPANVAAAANLEQVPVRLEYDVDDDADVVDEDDDDNGDDYDDADDDDGSSSEYVFDSSSDSISSSSEESFLGTTESDTANEGELSDTEVVDEKNLEYLKTENLKGTWNIVHEMRQRQHGLPYRAAPAKGGARRFNASQFQQRAYGSLHVMHRLDLLHRLEQHSGCVNSLSFNSSGKLLASGSDDLHVNLWHWESKKLLKSIASGHRSNVFQTKFMEYKGYEGELEIISTGRDGQVRHTRVDPSGRATTELLYRGHKAIHKISIPARNEVSFLTAGEDGKVRIFDLRQGKQEILKKLHRPLYAIASHPYDSEFCVAGNNSYVRVYDMRHTQKALKLLVSRRPPNQKTSDSVTCAVYNDNGTEILASYSEDDIYLYDNTTKQPVVKPFRSFQGHCNTQTIKGVNFFGPRSEYVVSGSDCGYIFIWDKRTGIIVNWLEGDECGAVNCLEPHPEFPILATSGVDHDVKIWVPVGPSEDQTVPVFDSQRLKATVLLNLQRRYMLFPRRLVRMARPITEYLNNAGPLAFRRAAGSAAERRNNDGSGDRSNNGRSDSDMDLNDDDDFLAGAPNQMLRCNPS